MPFHPDLPPPRHCDRFPERGPWIDAGAAQPPRFVSVSVLLPDGGTQPADWNGRVWWRDRELHPIAWRFYAPAHRGPIPDPARE